MFVGVESVLGDVGCLYGKNNSPHICRLLGAPTMYYGGCKRDVIGRHAHINSV